MLVNEVYIFELIFLLEDWYNSWVLCLHKENPISEFEYSFICYYK